MKQFPLVLAGALLVAGFGVSCQQDDVRPKIEGVDFRQEMRLLVQDISAYAKTQDGDFLVVPQNGIELISDNGEADGPLNTAYLDAVDAFGQEDLNYGYDQDDQATPSQERAYLLDFLRRAKASGKAVLATDYAARGAHTDDALGKSAAEGFLGFVAPERGLDVVPSYPVGINGENADRITTIAQVRNYLYLINPARFADKAAFIRAVQATNYDLLVMDAFDQNGLAFTAAEVAQLRQKANGGERLVLSYMSIGEAEDYRAYWQADWAQNKPVWLEALNPDWPGNYKVRYWDPAWKALLFGKSGAYLDGILESKFDGVYLDIIDGFEYFEG